MPINFGIGELKGVWEYTTSASIGSSTRHGWLCSARCTQSCWPMFRRRVATPVKADASSSCATYTRQRCEMSAPASSMAMSIIAPHYLTRLADSSLHHSTSTGRHEERRTATRDTRDARRERSRAAGEWMSTRLERRRRPPLTPRRSGVALKTTSDTRPPQKVGKHKVTTENSVLFLRLLNRTLRTHRDRTCTRPMPLAGPRPAGGRAPGILRWTLQSSHVCVARRVTSSGDRLRLVLHGVFHGATQLPRL